MQVYGLLERGAMQRATGTTKMNELSSRSHAVFIIIIEKSTVTSRQEADGDEMEQFRGLAPGAALSLSGIRRLSDCAACVVLTDEPILNCLAWTITLRIAVREGLRADAAVEL